jgi:hypothetical protein
MISDTPIDPLSGNAILNAIPVSLQPWRDQSNADMALYSERAKPETESYR